MNRQDKLSLWQERLRQAQAAAADERARYEEREALYTGTRQIDGALSPVYPKKQAAVVRNIVAEIIEAQIDANLPLPKVTARHKQHEHLAVLIEDYLRGEMTRLPMAEFNDMDERTTYIQGGDFALVEWDEGGGAHGESGEVALRLLHPGQVIPQPGVCALEEMDYVFIQVAYTKEGVRRAFGVDVSDEEGEGAALPHLVTLTRVYYRGEGGKIGLFSFVGDTVVEDLEDYQCRRERVCAVCGQPAGAGGCPVCGSGRTRLAPAAGQLLRRDVRRADGVVIPAGTRLPYYRPGAFPLVLRKNVSLYGKLLGDSDVDKIRDSQDAIKKTATKVQEKLLKGGSYVTLPAGKTVRRTDEELKVIEVDSPAEIAMISVVNLQPDVSRDMAYLEYHYQAARDVIGITDSFQGRRDETAVSGKAKEIAAAQSAGRLESKRVMKDAFYAKLFETMFRFALAYADEPRPVRRQQADGTSAYGDFNRYDFLEQGEDGAWYYVDDFLFSVDAASSPVSSRQAMWEETLTALQSGAFGPIGEMETLIAYWSRMAELHYPGAKETRQLLQQRQRDGGEGVAL